MVDVRIIPSITIAETYNSNPENAGNSQDIKSDFETSISPGISINDVQRGLS